jgi:hypothetical protein
VDKTFKGTRILEDSVNYASNETKIVLITVGEIGLLQNLSPNVRHIELDWTSDVFELVDLYRACDIFLMPSERESFGLMAAEAMSCGKTVLALNVPSSALPSTINSPRCGLAVPEKEYRSALVTLLASPNELLERGMRSLEFALKEYSYEKYISRTLDVYKYAIAKHDLSISGLKILTQLKKNSFNHRSSKDSHLTHSSSELRSLQVIIRLALLHYRNYGLKSTNRKIRRKLVKLHRIYGSLGLLHLIFQVIKNWILK